MIVSPESTAAVAELSPADCWSLLESSDLGRLAVVAGGEPEIFPINYLVTGERMIYFRSAPGSKLVELTEHPRVALEADGIVDRERWSVIVKGAAHRLMYDAEIERSAVMGLQSYSPTEKWNYVRIDVSSISGRRFRRAARTNSAART